MNLTCPDTTIGIYPHLTDDGVDSFIFMKFVWPDDNVGRVFLSPAQAKNVATALLGAAFTIDPENDR